MEDDVDGLSDSDCSKSAAILLDKIDHGKVGVLPSWNLFDLNKTLWDVFHSEEIEDYLSKVYPNETDSLDRFSFLRWYVDEEDFLDFADDAECLVSWGWNFSLIDIQWEISFRVRSLKM